MNKAIFVKRKQTSLLLAGALCVFLTARGQAQETRRPPVIEANAKKTWDPPPEPLWAEAPAVVRDLVPLVYKPHSCRGGSIAGPHMPNGLATPQPNSPKSKTAYYNFEDKDIYGFPQIHVHGTGGQGAYGMIMLMPQSGETPVLDWKQYLSPKEDEVLEPHAYAVTHAKFGVRTEMVPSHNAILYQMTFKSGEPAQVVFDLSYKGTDDLIKKEGGCHAIHADISENGRVVSGKGIYSGGWGSALDPYPVYFYVEFAQAPGAFATWKDGIPDWGSAVLDVVNLKPEEKLKGTRILNAPHAGVVFRFDKVAGPVRAKIGLSMRSVENARYFAQHQIAGFDLAKAKEIGRAEWNKRLSRILVEGPEDERKAFYTFLTHTWVMPRNKTGDDPYFWNTDYWDEQYSTWDTYRTLWPLKSLIDQRALAGTANFLITSQEQIGFIPRHFVAGVASSFGLNGDTGDNIVTEAVLKKIPGVDPQRAYAALKGTATKGGRRPDYLKNNQGWIPFEAGNQGPRRRAGGETVEDCIADGRIAQIARMLGHKEDAELFFKRSSGWEQLWNPDATDESGITGFMTPRLEDGSFVPVQAGEAQQKRHDPNQELDNFAPAGKKAEGGQKKKEDVTAPASVNVRDIAGDFFGEGCYWTYSLLVNHDPARLIEKCGGADKFIQRLELGYEKDLMGLGNEPGFFIPWLACYAGRPDIAAKWSRYRAIGMRNHKVYQLGPGGGYGGDDDSGAMSSWWIFWSMGLFPNGGSDIYLLHGPYFPKVTIQLENGKNLVIIGENASAENLYVQSCEFNGKPWNQCWIRHEDIMKGGTLKFVMGDKPSAWAHDGVPPPSLSSEF